MMVDRGLISTFMRFGAVGLANTGLGFAVTMGVQLGAGANAQIANACGYAVGFIASFTLNRAFVFPKGASISHTAIRFCLAGAIAFAVNQVILSMTSKVFGRDPLGAALSQSIAMATYTLTFFVLCRTWVFRPGPRRAAA